jgi:hypothetical protein
VLVFDPEHLSKSNPGPFGLSKRWPSLSKHAISPARITRAGIRDTQPNLLNSSL